MYWGWGRVKPPHLWSGGKEKRREKIISLDCRTAACMSTCEGTAANSHSFSVADLWLLKLFTQTTLKSHTSDLHFKISICAQCYTSVMTVMQILQSSLTENGIRNSFFCVRHTIWEDKAVSVVLFFFFFNFKLRSLLAFRVRKS